MMKKLLGSLLFALSTTAIAGGEMYVTKVQIGQADNMQYEYYYAVRILATAEDIGRPGGFYIGAIRNGEQAAYVSNGSWRVLAGGMGGATDFFGAIPSGWHYYNPMTGKRIPQPSPALYSQKGTNEHLGSTEQVMCSFSGKPFELLVGVGSLTPEKEALVQEQIAISKTLDANHLRNVYVQMNMQEQKKYWQIYSFSCANMPTS